MNTPITRFPASTNWGNLPYDDFVPQYRARTLDIPAWFYDFAKAATEKEESFYVRTSGGLALTAREGQAALLCAMATAYYTKE